MTKEARHSQEQEKEVDDQQTIEYLAYKRK